MIKPNLKISTLPTTAKTATFHNTTTNKRNSEDDVGTKRKFSIYPSSTTFHKVPATTLKFNQKRQQKKIQVKEQSEWVNTQDIQNIIKKNIALDNELSNETIKNFQSEKYILGPERICTQRIFPIPLPIEQAFRRLSQSSDQRLTLVYGYLKGPNSVYYIIGQSLYLINLQNMKQSKNKGKDIELNPLSIRPNCRKIHQISTLNNNIIPQQLEGNILILEYPYQIQICAYKFQHFQKIEEVQNFNRQLNESLDRHAEEKRKVRNSIKMINLHTRIPLQTGIAQFIVATPRGDLLYLDSNGLLNCFSFKIDYQSKIRKKNHRQNQCKKQTFMGRNKGIFKQMKNTLWKVINFRHCLSLSKKKNLNLIFDQKRNKVYTLTMKGDISTMVQQLKKQIRVYEFKTKDQNVQLNCLWSISQQQLLSQVKQYFKGKMQAQIFSIEKVQAQYNLQADLIIILSNGMKLIVQIQQKIIKVLKYIEAPDVLKMTSADQERRQNFIKISNVFFRKQSKNIAETLTNPFKIPSKCFKQSRMKIHYSNRSLSMSAIRHQQRIYFFMVNKDPKSEQIMKVLPIRWFRNDLVTIANTFPLENSIQQNSNGLQNNQINRSILQLQQKTRNVQLKSRAGYDITRTDLANGNQYLKQVYCSPSKFIYLSNRYFTTIYLLRPIDYVCYLVLTKDIPFCQNYLCSIVNTTPKQVCSMLLQLYSENKGSYYISKNYRWRIQNFYESFKNYKKYVDQTEKLLAHSRNSMNQYYSKKNRQSFKESQQDEIVQIDEKINEQALDKIRVLFRFFCKSQEHHNLISQNSFFRQITINDGTQTSNVFEEQIDKLPLQRKIQVQMCLLYISRVLYPFWNIQFTLLKQSNISLKNIKQKVRRLFSIVEVLKKIGNHYWKRLQIFVNKIAHILEMISYIFRMPSYFTLASAINKSNKFFQPFIFSTLKNQVHPQMVFKYKELFSCYISDQFILLMKVFMQIRMLFDHQKIKKIIKVLPYYPDYFVNYLSNQKYIKDLGFLNIQGDKNYSIDLELPNLCFQNLLDYIFDYVKTTRININNKYLYLRQARKLLDEYKDPKAPKKQIIHHGIIERLQKQYKQLLTKLKLQQQMKSELIKKIKQDFKRGKRSNQSIIVRFINKLRGSQRIQQDRQFKKQSQCQRSQQSRALSQLRKTNPQLQQHYKALQYEIMSRQDLNQFCQILQCPRLIISFLIGFEKQGMIQRQMEEYKRSVVAEFSRMVQIGWQRVYTQRSGEIEGLSKLTQYLKLQIKELYIFCNSIYKNIDFLMIYTGIKEVMVRYVSTFDFLSDRKNTEKYILYLPKYLIELGYDNNVIISYLFRVVNNSSIQGSRNNQNQENLQAKRWIYDFYMLYSACLHCKKQKREFLERLLLIIENFLKQNQNLIKKPVNQNILTFLNLCKNNLLKLINQRQFNNTIDR